jgi:phospholipase C
VALSAHSGRLIERALEYSAGITGSLDDIEHLVILMHENRAFDHYFGTMSGVRGFSDPNVLHQVVGGKTYPIWDQFGYNPGTQQPDPNAYLQPFHLLSDPPTYCGQCVNDISHEWPAQHAAWNNGRMDGFVSAHLDAGVNGFPTGLLPMGYFTRADLSFYYGLADAFTVCDHYFCSLIGPTDPNRLYLFSASIDPAGTAGGPILDTLTTNRQSRYGKLGWTTMPENLLDGGVTWKVYADPLGSYILGCLQYFAQYQANTSRGRALAVRAFDQHFPEQFKADVAANTLPQVSWIIPPVWASEHPGMPPEYGEYVCQMVFDILVSNPAIWAKTALIFTYDENGGFFDHVPPPTAPAGTEGEYLTANPLPSTATGPPYTTPVIGPIGLGFRVPTMIVSPFSRGGYLASEVFDHTSTLRLISKRFGVPTPPITQWRLHTTGDLTSAFDFVRPPNTVVPNLPQTSLTDPNVEAQVDINAILGLADKGQDYPPPTRNSMPVQETKPPRPRVP